MIALITARQGSQGRGGYDKEIERNQVNCSDRAVGRAEDQVGVFIAPTVRSRCLTMKTNINIPMNVDGSAETLCSWGVNPYRELLAALFFFYSTPERSLQILFSKGRNDFRSNSVPACSRKYETASSADTFSR